MADTMYAWSKILYGAEQNADGTKKSDLSVAPGDEVDAGKLDVSDEDFQQLVDAGAVRNYPFPEELQDPLASPNQLIAQGLADSETVAATYGVSPELVDAYVRMRQTQQTPTEAEVTKEGTSTKPNEVVPQAGS